MNSMSSNKSSKLSGDIVVPGDKSISHRALNNRIISDR